jgi:hypothetical protein
LPKPSFVKLIAEANGTYDLRDVLARRREQRADADYSNVLAVVILLTTALSELTIPERFARVDFEAISFERLDHALHKFYGDNNIVPVYAYLTP